MANNYTQGAAVYEFKCPEDKKIMEDLLSTTQVEFDTTNKEDGPTDEGCWIEVDENSEDANTYTVQVYKYQLENIHNQSKNEALDCNFEIVFERNSLYIFGEEYLDLEKVADLMEAFFKRSSTKDYFYMETASTCSKMRPGQFGGSAMFVAKDRIEFYTTAQWVENQIAAWKFDNA